MMFHSRKKKDPDPYLDWKVRLFLLGALLAMIGLAMESSLVVGLAIAVLFAGVVLRLFPRS